MPLIVTLKLDSESQTFFENMRQLHFPAALNKIPAHLTLFHQLPASEETAHALSIEARLQESIELQVTGLRSLGKGVAYVLDSPALLKLHRGLSHLFSDHLIPQDRQRFLPHIVVQNKVSTQQASTLLAELQKSFAPRIVSGIGLDVWEYLGGPWRHVNTYSFHLVH